MKDIKKRVRWVIIMSLFIILIFSLFYSAPKFNFSGKAVAVSVTKENLAGYFEKEKIVKDLPKDSLILLKFYNFNKGAREWEDSYVIKRGSVKKDSAENPDIIIILHSKYIPELGDLCSAIKKAKANNDFAYETKMNIVNFLWKYNGMLKYRNCFGF